MVNRRSIDTSGCELADGFGTWFRFHDWMLFDKRKKVPGPNSCESSFVDNAAMLDGR